MESGKILLFTSPLAHLVMHRHYARIYRHAAYLALTAMLLLMAGPVIGQFSAYDASGHGQHSKSSIPTMEQTATASSTGGHSPLKVLSWHEQCNYCLLFYHCPVLSAVLPPVVHEASIAAVGPIVATRLAHGHLAVFPHALTRAPPIATR